MEFFNSIISTFKNSSGADQIVEDNGTFTITPVLTLPHLLILHSCHIVPLSIVPDSRKQWTQLAIISFPTCRDLHRIAPHILHNVANFSVTSAVWAMLKHWQLSPLHLLVQRTGAHKGPDIGDLLIRGLITCDPKIAPGSPP